MKNKYTSGKKLETDFITLDKCYTISFSKYSSFDNPIHIKHSTNEKHGNSN